MARLSEETLTQLKEQISLVEWVSQRGHKLTPVGKDFTLLCPFHEEKTPSCKITPEKNLFHCFGCGAAGSIIDWVQKEDKLSFRQACDQLMQAIGLSPSLKGKSKYQLPSEAPANSEPLVEEDDAGLMRQVIDYYHEVLKQSPEALAYLKKRGLHDKNLIEKFKLGFANRTLGYRLPSVDSNRGKALRGRLRALGLLREKTGHEHFNGCLVVPIINDGEVKEIYGRKVLGKRLRKGTAQHLYLPGPHAGVWNAEDLDNQSPLILCESLIDAMTFWVNGFTNVTTSYGTRGFTDDLKALLLHKQIKEVHIAYDRDQAGNEAATALAAELAPLGMSVMRVEFPLDKDANETALDMPPAQATLGLALRQVTWLAGSQRANKPMAIEMSDNMVMANVEHEDNDVPAITEKENDNLPANGAAGAALPALPDDEHEGDAKELMMTREKRRYRVRGLDKNTSLDVMKVNVLVSDAMRMHMDTLDLYNARHRTSFIKQASIELGCASDVVKQDLAAVLLKLEQVQQDMIKGVLE